LFSPALRDSMFNCIMKETSAKFWIEYFGKRGWKEKLPCSHGKGVKSWN
jgi:hypothetical protein